jgi:hypothetical protein
MEGRQNDALERERDKSRRWIPLLGGVATGQLLLAMSAYGVIPIRKEVCRNPSFGTFVSVNRQSICILYRTHHSLEIIASLDSSD